MVSRRYDRTGKLTGYTKSSRDIAEENAVFIFAARAAFFLCLIALPFAPLLLISLATFNELHFVQHIHELFAGVIAAIPTILGIWLLWRFRALRFVYFGLEFIGIAIFVFISVSNFQDRVWATLAAVVVLAIGWVATRTIANFGFEPAREGN